MPPELKTLGQRIAYARRFRPDGRLTQVQLARAAGLAANNLGYIERDLTKNPGAHLVLRIAKALGVSMEWLLEGTEEGTSAGESTPATPADVQVPRFTIAE